MSCAGHDCEFGQRISTSPSLIARSADPQSGHFLGIMNFFSAPVRFSITGPSTSGITSPALRITTTSPIKTPLRVISCALCRVALVTVEPATLTGSMNANGVTRPVRPTLTLISNNFVVTSSGGYLYAIAHLGALDVKPSSSCALNSFTFITMPSISCSTS
ncbi:unannotated protein [freshwater metagenome]|uniref:Unannotated protein n=1 Tax=freshwater metagenome TaxID=449393 RepID=A0A6J6GFL4_9ZZZZ